MPTPYFEVAHLTKHFSTDESTVAAIQDVSFSLQKGQFLSILGPSGCGKSTLFNLIAGLMQPDYGEIRLQGESMLLRPGLTGYAQVYGKYNTTPYDKLKLDLTYIRNYSVLEDLKLIIMTPKIMLMKESTEGVKEEQQ